VVVSAKSVDERRLVRDARLGSSEAVAAIFREHWAAVWRAALVVLGSHAEADDVAQDAILAGIAALDRFDHDRPLGPWLRRIAVNRSLDRLRATRRLTEFDEQSDAVWALDDWVGHADLADALRLLAPERRIVVVLRFLVDMPLHEVAECLSVPRGTASSRLSRALDDLRAIMEAPDA
jgi:RNA polymerase sigma-70 factor (ECF subfamily)